jgi:hypothetical protein
MSWLIGESSAISIVMVRSIMFLELGRWFACLHRRQPGYPDLDSTDGWLAGSLSREIKFRRGEQSETATV